MEEIKDQFQTRKDAVKEDLKNPEYKNNKVLLVRPLRTLPSMDMKQPRTHWAMQPSTSLRPSTSGLVTIAKSKYNVH